MDRATARQLVALKAEDKDQTRFTETQYNTAIDLAEEQFALDARAIIRETTLTSLADTFEIALPTDFMVAVLARHKGLKLRPVTKYGLSWQNGTDWTTMNSGTPVAFYIDDEDEKIGTVPKPSASEAGANLLLNYVAKPATISSDSTVLLSARSFLQYYSPAVVAWAAREVLTYLPMSPEIKAKMDELMGEYERYKDHCISTYNNMADEPIQMRGGRDWQDRSVDRKNDAFSN